jgi:hypothetical protein
LYGGKVLSKLNKNQIAGLLGKPMMHVQEGWIGNVVEISTFPGMPEMVEVEASHVHAKRVIGMLSDFISA